MSYCFARSSIKNQVYMGKIHDLIPILSKITKPVAAIKSLRFAFSVSLNLKTLPIQCIYGYHYLFFLFPTGVI